jgi:hypothetical protein
VPGGIAVNIQPTLLSSAGLNTLCLRSNVSRRQAARGTPLLWATDMDSTVHTSWLPHILHFVQLAHQTLKCDINNHREIFASTKQSLDTDEHYPKIRARYPWRAIPPESAGQPFGVTPDPHQSQANSHLTPRDDLAFLEANRVALRCMNPASHPLPLWRIQRLYH